MSPELVQKLMQKYPKLFAAIEGEYLPIAQRGIEVPDGWYDLVDQALASLSLEPSTVTIAQIKEKFGELRFYTDGAASTRFYESYQKLQELSRTTCEECGKNATCSTLNYWTRTLCPEHWDELKKRGKT